MTLVKFILDIKSQAWISANQSKVLLLNEPIYREDGMVAFGDGTTPLSGLTFKPVFTGSLSWGSITGNITDQADLVSYVNSVIPSLTYAQSSSSSISFTSNTIYGTYTTPLTGALGFVYPGVEGVISIIIHSDSIAPSFDTWKRLDGSYVTGQVNYIIAQYLSTTNIIYSIKQIQE